MQPSDQNDQQWGDDPEVIRQIAIVREAPEGTVFTQLWRNKFLCTDVESIGGFRDKLAAAVATLDRWMAAGVTLDENLGSIADDYAVFATTSKEVALEEGFFVIGGSEGDAELFSDESVLSMGSGFDYILSPDDIPASTEALVALVAQREKELVEHAEEPYEPFDETMLNEQSDLTILDIRFSEYLLKGKKRTKRIGDRSHNMTYAEILWRLHKSVAKDKLGDHIYFEGLTFIEMGEDGVPLFEVFMGS